MKDDHNDLVSKTPVFTAVKDHGGERRRFGLGGERESSAGKGRFDLLPMRAIRRLAQHYENGAQKYSERNWEKGLPLSRFIDSAFRHLADFMDGDRSEDHLAAILWNIAGYIWTEDMIAAGRLPADLKDVPWPPSLVRPMAPKEGESPKDETKVKKEEEWQPARIR